MSRQTAALIGVVIAAYAGLAGLQAARGLPVPAQPGQPGPHGYREWVGSLNQFDKTTSGDDFVLRYGFIDHQGAEQHIQCDISKSEHRRLAAAFGIDRNAFNAELVRRLRAVAEEYVEETGIAQWVEVTISPTQWQVSYRSIPSQLADRVEAAGARLVHEVMPAASTRIQDELYADRGFVVEGDMLRIDYEGLMEKNMDPLENCFDAIYDAGRSYGLEAYLGLVVAFMQEIQYKVPPPIVDGRESGGLWVPTEVLSNDHGDCDSKAVTFGAMWLWLRDADILVINIPNHTLVGVAMPRPRPGQYFIRMGNRYYILCEPVGPGKLYPGEKTIEGDYQYWRVQRSSDEDES